MDNKYMSNKFFQKQIIIFLATISLSACAGPHKIAKTKRPEMAKSKLVVTDTQFGLPNILPVENIQGQSKEKLLANHYLLNPDKTLSVDIASSGYSRVSMEGERIKDVFVYPQEVINIQIHDQGYLILVPSDASLNDSIKDQIYLTVSGEKGTTQDFVLRFRGGAPSPIKFIKSVLEQQQLSTNQEEKNDNEE
jgi:hypothetical protein